MEVKGQNIIMTAEYYHIYLSTTTRRIQIYLLLMIYHEMNDSGSKFKIYDVLSNNNFKKC